MTVRDIVRPVVRAVARSVVTASAADPVLALFASAEKGGYYDPSDLSTVFEDSAGTVPASVNGVVGRINDKSGNSLHATQATTSLKPILRQSGALYYLEFDGVDDILSTAACDLTGTDSMTVWAGVRKVADGQQRVVCELGANPTATNGCWTMVAPSFADGNFYFGSRGTSFQGAEQSGHNAPVTRVVCGISDISGPLARVRVNRTVTSNVTSQGTGNYQNLAINIGKRSSGVNPLNGWIFALVIRGATSTADEITAGEDYIAGKTGVSL